MSWSMQDWKDEGRDGDVSKDSEASVDMACFQIGEIHGNGGWGDRRAGGGGNRTEKREQAVINPIT